MTTQTTFYQLKSTKQGYCKSEIIEMTRVIFDNSTTIQHFGGTVSQEIFEQMAEATQGRRTPEQMRSWLENLKKTFEDEKRLTKAVKQALSPDDLVKLVGIIFAKGPPDTTPHTSLYPPLPEEKLECKDENENLMKSTGSLTKEQKKKKKKGIGCFSFLKKRHGSHGDLSTDAYGGPLELLEYDELGAEKKETSRLGHHLG